MLIVLLAADWVRLKTANMILSSSPVPVGQENTSLALYIQFTKTAGKLSPLLTEQWWQSKSRLCMYIGLYTLDRAVAFCFLLKVLLRNHSPLGFCTSLFQVQLCSKCEKDGVGFSDLVLFRAGTEWMLWVLLLLKAGAWGQPLILHPHASKMGCVLLRWY